MSYEGVRSVRMQLLIGGGERTSSYVELAG